MSFRSNFAFWVSSVLILSGCQQKAPLTPHPSTNKLPYILVTPNPQATTTSTPFLPDTDILPTQTPVFIFPTSTPENTAIPSTFTPWATNTQSGPSELIATPNFSGNSFEDYPKPLYYSPSISIPPPVGMITQPKDQINILLLGSDIRPYSTDFRTDTIILLTIDKSSGSVNMTSIPRDLYVYIPGWTMQRINTAMGYAGYDTLGMTMAYNFGVYPDHYLMVNFTKFISIVNSLGGIDVEVGQNFADQRSGYGWYQVQQGTVHMDGDTALWYVRSRYTTSDIDRLRRAQEVIQAIGYRLLSFDVLTRMPELYKIYKDSVFTDLGFADFASLLPTAKKLLDTQNIRRFAIGYGPVYDWTEPYSGAMVLLPHRNQIIEIMHEVLNSP